MREENFHKVLLISIFVILIFSAIGCHDIFTWFLEVLPAIIVGVILIETYKRFKFTNFVYVLMWFHAIILIVGGHYTYAEMPLFNWVRDTFDLSRNYYDRLGHFAQGFVPDLVIRELFIRKSIIKNIMWINFIVVAICLAISASYEIVEFIVAVITGEAADAFLGTQGDIWDTQWDMILALIGSTFAVVVLGKYHENLLKNHM